MRSVFANRVVSKVRFMFESFDLVVNDLLGVERSTGCDSVNEVWVSGTGKGEVISDLGATDPDLLESMLPDDLSLRGSGSYVVDEEGRKMSKSYHSIHARKYRDGFIGQRGANYYVLDDRMRRISSGHHKIYYNRFTDEYVSKKGARDVWFELRDPPGMA